MLCDVTRWTICAHCKTFVGADFIFVSYPKSIDLNSREIASEHTTAASVREIIELHFDGETAEELRPGLSDLKPAVHDSIYLYFTGTSFTRQLKCTNLKHNNVFF